MGHEYEFYKKVADFINANYADTLDNGLMDDVLFSEYKAGVEKLSCAERDEEQCVNLERWLGVIIGQMVECAKDNIAVGRRYNVYEKFLECFGE